jgi:dUTP pyrophosphatase
MNIKFKKLTETAKSPKRAHETDAGFDFYCDKIVVKDKYLVYHTGIAVEMPKNMVGLAFPRSSVIKKDMMLKNSVGVIDTDYRGEIIFMYHKFGDEIFSINERVGQLVFLELPRVSMIEVDELSETDRGQGGFGSSGK